MRAWLMDSYQGVDKLRLGEVADPVPGPNEVLLQVTYAALNPADAFLAQGLYPSNPPLPHILGRDGVGVVVAVGPGGDASLVGKTFGILRGVTGVTCWGTLAEKVVVPITDLTPVPKGWTLQEMAGGPLVFLTAWQALTQWGEPAEGAVVLVTGASGGVGTATVILAKAMKLTVIALSRSREKGERLKTLGADFVFDPAEERFSQKILKAIEPKRVDIVVDSVAGKGFPELIATLGYRGAISLAGRTGGPVPEFNTATLFFRRNRLGGVNVGDYSREEVNTIWQQIVALLDKAGRRPVIDSTFPFEQVPQAFDKLAKGPMGKVIISF